MQGIKRTKKIIIVLLIMLSTLVCSLVPIKIFQDKKRSITAPTAVYVFSGSPLSHEDYSNNTEFVIKDEAGWESFHKSTIVYPNIGGSPITRTYEGKKVYLEADISITKVFETAVSVPGPVSTAYWPSMVNSFAGTFDGLGHTINFPNELTIKSTYTTLFIRTLESNGEVRNIKFTNVQIQPDSGSGSNNFGTIVGVNHGLVENCIIDGFKCKSNRFKSNCSVAPLVGTNNGQVKNCIVTGYYEIGGADGNGLLNEDGCYAYYFVTGGNKPTNCVFDTKVITFGDHTEECIKPEDHDSLGSNYTSYATARTKIQEDISSDSGDLFEQGNEKLSSWYKFNDGYGLNGKGDKIYTVYLRAFMTWTTINFVAGTGGFVSQNDLVIPNGCEAGTISGSRVTIYGTTITATPTNELWAVANPCWVAEGTELYTANFVQKYIYVQFNDCIGTGVSVIGNKKVLADKIGTLTEFKVIQNKVNAETWRLSFNYRYNGSWLYFGQYQDMSNKYYYVTYTCELIGDTLHVTPTCSLKTYGVEVA